MDIGDSAIGKIEEYFGRGWTRFLLIIGYLAALCLGLSTIFSSVIIPVYKVWQTPSVQTVIDTAQTAGSSVITTLFLTVLIFYLLIDMPRQNRREEETKALLIAVEAMRDSREAEATSARSGQDHPPAVSHLPVEVLRG